MNLLRLFLFLVLALAAAQTHAEQGPCSASWKKAQSVKLKKLNSSLRIEKSFKKRQTSQCRARNGKARQACLSLSAKQQKKINSLKIKIANRKALLAECVKPSPTASASATPQPTPTATATATPTPLTANTVSQWGVSWEFDKAYQIGQFANGDYWVVPPSSQEAVTIVSMSPAFAGGLNGWQVNPLPGANHGLDIRVQGWKSDLVPALPYAAHAGDSIVKTISLPGTCVTVDTRCLRTAAVLTVLSEPPPGGGAAYFRPPFSGSQNPLIPIS
ncbi:MAG: hypothetical protein J0M12_05065, partial [Deltaproteobacteria bacterium]|nr:hypothetical protein [Deltaproteobacteria bacterium]